MEVRVMLNNSQEKKQEVEDQRRNVKFSKNKTSVTACNDSLNTKTSNVNFVCATCGKCMLNEKHDMYVLKSLDGVNCGTKMPIAVPVSTREPKRTIKQSAAKPLRKTVASESNQKPRNTTTKLYEHNKAITISELKKLIEKLKGKSMDTKFEKSSVIRKLNAFKSQRPSILGKPTIFSDSLERKDFSKSKPVTKNNVSNDFSKPVTAQILPSNKKSILKNTNVHAPGMYKLHTKPTQTRTTQLPKDFKKTNKRVSFSTGVIPTTCISKPQLKINLMEDRVTLNNSQGKKQDVEDHHRNFKFFKN
nr:hypothetical protein [Tanacetum cinerariifolium]